MADGNLFFEQVFYPAGLLFGLITHELGIEWSKDYQKYQNNQCRHTSQGIEAEATSNPDAGHNPHCRSGRKAMDSSGGLDNRPGAQEPNALHHNGGDTGCIRALGKLGKNQYPSKRHDGRSESDKGICPHASRLLPNFAFNADKSAQNRSGQ